MLQWGGGQTPISTKTSTQVLKAGAICFAFLYFFTFLHFLCFYVFMFFNVFFLRFCIIGLLRFTLFCFFCTNSLHPSVLFYFCILLFFVLFTFFTFFAFLYFCTIVLFVLLYFCTSRLCTEAC